jgi:hypothetical protein
MVDDELRQRRKGKAHRRRLGPRWLDYFSRETPEDELAQTWSFSSPSESRSGSEGRAEGGGAAAESEWERSEWGASESEIS